MRKLLKALFKRKPQEVKAEPVFPSLDERPLFDKPTLKTVVFEVEGMLQSTLQAALQENLQHYMEQNNENRAIDQLQFTSAQVIFFPDKDNTTEPHATKVYLDLSATPLHIGYVPNEVAAQLIDIINGKKARSFKGTFHETQTEHNEQPTLIFQIEIQHI